MAVNTLRSWRVADEEIPEAEPGCPGAQWLSFLQATIIRHCYRSVKKQAGSKELQSDILKHALWS